MAKTLLMTSFVCRSTAYYPPPPGGYASEEEARLEGGDKDRMGKPLRTLQDFLAKKAEYVSVAMDTKEFPYGTRLCIPELDEYYGKAIEFRVVDTGGAFKGKKRTRLDICVKTERDSYHPMVNQILYCVALA